MAARKCLAILCATLGLSAAAVAGGIQSYLERAAQDAKAAHASAEKRAGLTTAYDRLAAGTAALRGSPLLSADERAAIARVDAMLTEVRDELAGRNGYARVADDRLDLFAGYVVQNMEQADTYITISLVTLLLIIIIIILIVR